MTALLTDEQIIVACHNHAQAATRLMGDTVVITCDGIDGTPTYLAHASHARVRRGVWQWREAATGDRYLATIPCTASQR